MNRQRNWLRLILLAIAAATVLTGAIQAIKPDFILGFVGAEITATSKHFFAIVGMFMVLFGGMMWQALRSNQPQPIPIFWGALQKFGAAAAVGLGVLNGIFSDLAWLVAGFDFLSGVLAILYWSKLPKNN